MDHLLSLVRASYPYSNSARRCGQLQSRVGPLA